MAPDGDKFWFYAEVTGMFEAQSKPKPGGAALAAYWDAMASYARADVQAAILRAMRELKWPARPVELRDFIRIAHDGLNTSRTTFRCHAHGDGLWEPGGVGRPNAPSRNQTAWWCDRCAHFVKCGQQATAEVAP